MTAKQTILIITGAVFGALSGLQILRNLFNWWSSHDLVIFSLTFPIALYLLAMSVFGLLQTSAKHKHFVAMLAFGVGLLLTYISIASVAHFGLLTLPNIGLLNIYIFILAFALNMVYMFPRMTEN